MHLVTLNAAGHASPGVIAGDSILDLGAAVAILSVAKLIPSGMRGLLEGVDAALDLLIGAKSAKREGYPRCGAP